MWTLDVASISDKMRTLISIIERSNEEGQLRMKKGKKKKKTCKQATRLDGSALSFLFCLFVCFPTLVSNCMSVSRHPPRYRVVRGHPIGLAPARTERKARSAKQRGYWPQSYYINGSNELCTTLWEHQVMCASTYIPLKKITIKIKKKVALFYLPYVIWSFAKYR